MTDASHPRLGRVFACGLLAAVVFCLTVAVLSSRWIAADLRRFVTGEFNEEQLLLARHARTLLENELNRLARRMQRNGAALAAAGDDQQQVRAALVQGLALGREDGVRAAHLIFRGRPEMLTCDTFRPLCRQLPAPDHLLAWSGAELPPSEVRLGEPRIDDDGPVVDLAIAPGPGSVLVLELDLTRFLGPYLQGVRSGSTGYAWLIDDNGNFLFHPETDYVGRNAFTVRQDHYPDVPYERINGIQRDRMLAGLEGTSSYESGSHRGLTGRIEKLIAFAPVRLPGEPERHWSLAVVAPVAELEAALGRGSRWNLVLGGLTVAVVALAAGAMIVIQRRWARTLERRVTTRTAALARSEERYRSLVEGSEEAIFTLDAQANLDQFNSATARLFSAGHAIPAGLGLADLLPGETGRRQVGLVNRVLAGGRSVRGEFALARDGRTVWLNAGYMPLATGPGTVDRILCIVRDVTEQKELERNLLHTERLATLGTLAAGVAHEINNPLGVMLGFCELLQPRFPADSQERQDLQVIERQGLHCKAIVDNLLGFARSDPETVEHSDLDRCIRDAVGVVRHNLEMRDIRLETSLAGDLPPVRGDSRRLQQVFLNLLANALAALPDGGSIHIASARDEDSGRLVATVRDDGCGIPTADLQRVFEPFFTTKPPGEGTGLGLFVSYGIVSKYGGTLTCASREATARNRGETTFTINLPQRSGETS